MGNRPVPNFVVINAVRNLPFKRFVIYLFIGCAGSSLPHWIFSSRGKQGRSSCGGQASCCSGFSCCRAQTVGAQAAAVRVPGSRAQAQ